MGCRKASIIALVWLVAACGKQTEPSQLRHSQTVDAGSNKAQDDDANGGNDSQTSPGSNSSGAPSGGGGGAGGGATASNPGLGGENSGGSATNGTSGGLGVGGTAGPNLGTGGQGGAGKQSGPGKTGRQISFLGDEQCGAPLVRGFRKLLPAQAKRALLSLDPDLSLPSVDDEAMEHELDSLRWLTPFPSEATSEDVIRRIHDEVFDLAPTRFPQLFALVDDAVSQWVTLHQPVEACEANAPLTDCLLVVLKEVASTAYRRPLFESEKRELVERALLDADPELADPNTAVHDALLRILLNPNFLARSELGNPISTFRVLLQAEPPPIALPPEPAPLPANPAPEAQWVLTEYELATAVAFDLTDGPPDQELLDLAAAAILSDYYVLWSQVDRLFAAPTSHEALSAMTLRWFGIDPPLPDDELAMDAYLESLAFAERVLWSGGTLSDLLQSTDARLSDELATVYGVEPTESGTWASVADRPGLLSRLAFGQYTRLQGYYRHGLLLEAKLGCLAVPAPPLEAHNPLPPEAEYATATQEAQCAPCHELFSPVSNPFLFLNGIGTEPGGTYWADGALTPFADIVELMGRLSTDQVAFECATRSQALTLLDTVDTDEHRCWLDALESHTFAAPLYDVVRYTVLSSTYRVRR